MNEIPTELLINLEYSFVARPMGHHIGSTTFYESRLGLWRECSDETTGMSYRIIDNLLSLRYAVDEASGPPESGNFISLIVPGTTQAHLTVLLLGSRDYVEATRSRILETYFLISTRSIPLLGTLFGGPETNEFLDRLNQVAALHNVEIIIDNNPTVSNSEPVVLSKDWFVHVVGKSNQTNAAELAIRVLVSYHLLNTKHYIEKVDVLISQVPAIGGPDFAVFSQIAIQTGVNIFIPDTVQNLYGPSSEHTSDTVSFWITAPSIPELLCAKLVLESAIQGTCSEYATQTIIIPTHTKDRILINYQSQLLNIMFARGVYIQLDHLGSPAKSSANSVAEGTRNIDSKSASPENSTVTFQSSAENCNSIKDAIVDFCGLYKDFYTLTINLVPADTRHHRTIAVLYNIVRSKKSCSASVTNHVFTVVGARCDLKQIFTQITTARKNNAALSADIAGASIALEIEADQRDFVSGKKNGKLTKIIGKLQNAVTLTLDDNGGETFPLTINLVDHSRFQILAKALTLLEQELPAQVEFNVPEVYHKSIIGNGGGLIQSILKRLNVFIKFSTVTKKNSKSRPYTFHRENNVLVKCPHKNGQSIAQVKHDIDQLVQKYCADNELATTGPSIKKNVYRTLKFELLRGQYILLVESNKLGQIKALESELGVFIDFPLSLENIGARPLHTVQVRGPGGKVGECMERITELMPKTYEFRLMLSPARFDEVFVKAVAELNERLVAPLHILLKVQLTALAWPMGARDHADPYQQIILSYYDSEKLKEASDAVTAFLREKGFLILTKGVFNSSFVLDEEADLSTQGQTPDTKTITTDQTASTTNTKSGPRKPAVSSHPPSKRRGKRGLSLMQGAVTTSGGFELVYQSR